MATVCGRDYEPAKCRCAYEAVLGVKPAGRSSCQVWKAGWHVVLHSSQLTSTLVVCWAGALPASAHMSTCASISAACQCQVAELTVQLCHAS